MRAFTSTLFKKCEETDDLDGFSEALQPDEFDCEERYKIDVPISSARMQLSRFRYNKCSQLMPSNWYSFKVTDDESNVG